MPVSLKTTGLTSSKKSQNITLGSLGHVNYYSPTPIQLKNEAEEGIIRAEAEIKELDQKIQLDRDIYAVVDESLESLKNLSKLYL